MKTYSTFKIDENKKCFTSLIMGSCLNIEDAVNKTISRINELGFSKHYRNNPEFKFLVEEYEDGENDRELFTVTIKIEKA